MEHSEVKLSSYRRHSFPSRYTRGDIELLAETDEAHETLAGRTRQILKRQFEKFKHPEYERLAGIRWRIFTTSASVRAIASGG